MELATQRLRLREFVEEDWEAVLAYQKKPAYLRYYEWQDRTEREVREFVQMFIDNQQEKPRHKYQLAVTLLHSGQLIGNCGIRRETIDSREAELGYELDPAYWGKGYATEVTRAMVRFGFEELGVHRIEAWCVVENTSSWNVLEKLGFQREGHLRDKHYYKGRWWDTLLYAILETEWREIYRNE